LASDVELRLSVNGGGDVSCANSTADNSPITITEAVCNNAPCTVEDGGARLGQINIGDEKIVLVKFIEPPIKGDYRIDCRFVRRAKVS